MEKNKSPLVSVVIPSFNCSSYIKKTLDSVLLQSYKNIEIIVIDDHSNDSTRGVLSLYKSNFDNVHLVFLDENSGGPAHPRNIGINLSNGKYIAFIDSDDIWHPDKINSQVKILEEEKVGAVCAAMVDFREERDVVHVQYRQHTLQELTYKQTLRKSLVPLSSLMMESKLAKLLTFNESRSIAGREDYLFILEYLCRYTKILKICEPLVYYRKRPNQISQNKYKMLKRQATVLHLHYRATSPRFMFFKITFSLCCHLVFSIYYRFILRRL